MQETELNEIDQSIAAEKPAEKKELISSMTTLGPWIKLLLRDFCTTSAFFPISSEKNYLVR